MRVTTLARFMEEQGIQCIDLLKLDCEGAEWDILPSSIDILPKIGQICMEFHPDRGWTVEKLAGLLRDGGFEVIHTPAEMERISVGDSSALQGSKFRRDRNDPR